MRTHRSTGNSALSNSTSTVTLHSIVEAVLVVAIATAALLTVGSSPALAGGSIRSHPVNLAQPAFRSVVVGATVVSLATLDLPGPVSVPTVPTTTTTTTTSPPVVTPPAPDTGGACQFPATTRGTDRPPPVRPPMTHTVPTDRRPGAAGR